MPPITKLIALHGVGSRGADFAGLLESWTAAMPGSAATAPDAPNRFDGGGTGRQWFSIQGVTPDNRPARIIGAREGYDRTVAQALSEIGAQPDASDAAFIGFSQGSIMSLDAVASGRWKPAALIAFSGRLSSPIEPGPIRTRILLVHGETDTVIPAQESADAAQRLKAAGFDVTLRREPGVPHTISGPGAAFALDWLRA